MSLKIKVIQPAIPSYRVDFFGRLQQSLESELSLYVARSPLNASDVSHKFLSDSPWVHILGTYHKLPLGLVWNPSLLRFAVQPNTIYVLCGNPRDITTIFLLLRIICLRRQKNIRVVWWSQYWSYRSNPIQQLLKLFFAVACDAICFYTDVELFQFKQIPLLRSKRSVIALSNGLNYSVICSYRRSYVPEKRSKSILFLGRVTDKSNLTLLLEALDSPLLQDVFLHIIGDGDLRAFAEKLAGMLCISHRVKWHGELHDEFALANVANTCLLSVYPGPVGLSAIHALSYGLPMIIHDNPKHHGPEHCAVIPLVTGQLYIENSVDSLSWEIYNLINDYNRLSAMSANAVKIISSQYTTAVMADRFLHLVKSLVSVQH